MKASFKPRARLLKLLGDQLIGTPQLAIFELVKNSYDADAESVEVVISDPEDVSKAKITVTDFGGEGMDKDTLLNVWLEPGADHKERKRIRGEVTKKHKRLPLGEKGVGRFAVHKLGREIHLVTKAHNQKEIHVYVNWDLLDNCKYIEDAKIEFEQFDEPSFFKGHETGTRIVISRLNNSLSKSDVRNLHRNIESIKSPFEFGKYRIEPNVDEFHVSLEVPGNEDWLQDLLGIDTIISQSLFRFSFLFDGGKWSWDYEFTPPESMKQAIKFEGRQTSQENVGCEIASPNYRKEYLSAPKEFFDGLGPVLGEIYVFDFDAGVKSYLDEKGAIQKFLRENQGVRVYRDGIRIYNYGEPDDDWLEMDSRRVNRLGKGLNRRIVVGAISLSLKHTPTLIEKTNREGFIENSSFLKLKEIVASALGKLEALRASDKDRLRAITRGETGRTIESLADPLDELKLIVEENGWGDKLGEVIDKAERQYNDMKDIMLTAGMAGLNMSIAFHEIQHGISDAKRNLKAGKDYSVILEQFERFELLLDTYANLLKHEASKEVDLKSLLQANHDLAEVRFSLHDILFSCPALVGDQKSFSVKAPRKMLISAINNLIDNSIYWLDQRWGDEEHGKYIYIGVSDEFSSGPAIVVADSGPGWRDISKDDVRKPFRTTKPAGMGIGLYYTDMVMQMLGGELVLLDGGELESVPAHADGAVVALVFKGEVS